MEYLEAQLIKRYVRPDNLPGNLKHLPDEAERVIKLHKAMCRAGDTGNLALQLPVLSREERERVNAVLIYRLANECGLFQQWRGKAKPLPVTDDPHKQEGQPSLAPRGKPARPGGSARVLDHVE
jgi:hypothetical protein